MGHLVVKFVAILNWFHLYTRECEVDEPDPDGEHPPGGERRGVEGGEEDDKEYRLRSHRQTVSGSTKKRIE